jgi:hypothetical protein
LSETRDDQQPEDSEEFEEYEDQIEQMILENGMLTHSIINLLVKKGVLTRDEIDEEMDRLYGEAEEEFGNA